MSKILWDILKNLPMDALVPAGAGKAALFDLGPVGKIPEMSILGGVCKFSCLTILSCFFSGGQQRFSSFTHSSCTIILLLG